MKHLLSQIVILSTLVSCFESYIEWEPIEKNEVSDFEQAYQESFIFFGKPSITHINSSSTVSYELSYSTPPYNELKPSDISFTGTSKGCTVSEISNSNSKNPVIHITGCCGDGNVSISVATSILSQSTSNLLESITSDPITVDNTPPGIDFEEPSFATTSALSNLSYKLTYEIAPDRALKPEDITFTGDSEGCKVSSITNPKTVNPVVNVTGCTGDGEVTLTLAKGTSSDQAGNQDQGATSASFTVDNTPPSIRFGDPSFPITKSSSTLSYAIYYETAPVSAIESTDITFTGDSEGCRVSNITSSETVNPIIDITGCKGNGEVNVVINKGRSRDFVGNRDLGATSASFTVDNNPPSVSFGDPSSLTANAASIVSYTLTYEIAPDPALMPSDISFNGAS